MNTSSYAARTQKLDKLDTPLRPDANVVDERAHVCIVRLGDADPIQSAELCVEAPARCAAALDEAINARQLGQSNAGVDIRQVIPEALAADVILPRALVLVALGRLLVDAEEPV